MPEKKHVFVVGPGCFVQFGLGRRRLIHNEFAVADSDGVSIDGMLYATWEAAEAARAAEERKRREPR